MRPFLNKTAVMAIIISIIAAGVALRVVNLLNVEKRSPDELIYSCQAELVAEQGPIKGTASLIKEYNTTKKLWIYPPPTRIGYSWVLGTLMKKTANTETYLGSYISFAFSVVSLLLVALIGFRFFNPAVTIFALLFMAVSPPELVMARRTWQDAMFGSLGLLMAYFSMEIMRNPKRLVFYALLVVLGSYIMLVKEPGIIVYGLCILLAIWTLLVKEKAPVKAAVLAAAAAAGATLSVSLLIYACGGMQPILTVFRHVKEAMATNVYAIENQSGPWYYFPLAFWRVSPLSSLLFLAGAAGTMLPFDISDRPDAFPDVRARYAVRGFISFGLAFFAIALLTPYCQNLRYVSVVYGPFYLTAGLGLWYIVLITRPYLKNLAIIAAFLLAAALILAAIYDYQVFYDLFIASTNNDMPIGILR